MGIFVVWIALCFVAGAIASKKGRSSAGFFFLSFFLSPLVGIIGALIAKPNEEKVEQSKIEEGNSKKCPFCAEIIKAEAKVCRYCNRELAEFEEVDSIKEESTQKEKKGSTEPKDKKSSGYGRLYALLCVVAIGIIFINQNDWEDGKFEGFRTTVEPSLNKNSSSEVKSSKPSSVSSGQINKGFVEIGYYEGTTQFNSPNRVYSIFVEDFMDSPDVWDRIERYGKSKMWSPKGSTTVLFFNNRQGTPDVTYTGINFPDRYEPYCIAGYWKYTTGKEIFNKYPLKME